MIGSSSEQSVQCQSPQSVVVVLNHNEEKIIVRHHHELALLRPDPHERHVVSRVHLLEHGDGLVDEGAQDVAVLGGGGGVEGGLDGDSLLVIRNSYSSLSMSRMSHSLTLLTTTVPMTPL